MLNKTKKTYNIKSTKRSPLKRLLKGLGIAVLGLFVLIQFISYGRAHTNPPVSAEPKWDSPATKATFERTCAACHSNQTEWPWYSNVAPVSWLVQYDVNMGRSHFNVSEWGRRNNTGGASASVVRNGMMPPSVYMPMHADAKLSNEERLAFIRGLVATFGDTPPHVH